MMRKRRDRKADNRKLFAVFLSVTLFTAGIDFSSYAQLAPETQVQEETSSSSEMEESIVDIEEQTESETEIQSEIQTESESHTDTGTEGVTESQTETETQEETESQTETVTQEETTTEEESSLLIIKRFETRGKTLELSKKGTFQEAADKMPSAWGVVVSTEENSETEKSVEMPVTWTCEQDYENTELERYTFYPTWDGKYYKLAEGLDQSALPIIEVVFVEVNEGKVVVNSALKLQEAIDSSAQNIELSCDVELTECIKVSGESNLTIDGKGFSLLRGKNANGELFTGTMLQIGESSNDNTIGELTLQGIKIDANSKEQDVYSPVILNYGRLILMNGTIIHDNSKEGGVKVYGVLDVMTGAKITKNFAKEHGGGVYLADKSILHLYEDGIVENQVGPGGLGADLYASAGSTIYHNPSIDMKREGFYIDVNATLINMESGLRTLETDDGEIEIYLNVDKNSGYSLEEIKKKLEEELGRKVKILTPKITNVSTTDLRDWHVYDHYETTCWGTEDSNANGEPDKWEKNYEGSLYRKYYPFTETMVTSTASSVTTIKEWLGNPDYFASNTLQLAKFEEHIYSSVENGKPQMTFAGYGTFPYADFLFYDPDSEGEKVVDFDVDSSAVNTHTLVGNGFLVNAGLNGNNLNGYLVFYKYGAGNKAASVSIYEINNVDVDKLHGNGFNNVWLGNPLKTVPISNWDNKMSIQIVATPTKIEVRQQPTSDTNDISTIDPIIELENTESQPYSGFGPLVKYNSHGCSLASSFTYSNLRMYFTDPEAEAETLLNSLQQADFTQDIEGSTTRRYFLNLLGDSEVEYNSDPTFNQYQSYIKMMQKEGIGLITDRDTAFEHQLGTNGSNNLLELPKKPSLDDLVTQLKTYLDKDLSTKWPGDPLVDAQPNVSAGNIWLSQPDGSQLRQPIDGDKLPEGYKLKVNNISIVKDGNHPKYFMQKPGSKEFEELTLSEDGSFSLEIDLNEWPAGEYTVKVQYENDLGTDSPIFGYSYFDITRTNATYKLLYDANGGTGEVPVDSGNYISGETVNVVFTPKPTKEGKEFHGWSMNPTDKNPVFIEDSSSNAFVRFRGEDITLYAIWEKEGFDIGGEVVEPDNTPAKGAEVRVIRGNTQYGNTAITDEYGIYKIYGVLPGNYNVVVTKDGKIVTEKVAVVNQDVEVGKIKLPVGITNSILVVGRNTPDIVVGKLNELFPEPPIVTDDTKGYTAADKAIVDAGGKAVFTFHAEEKVPQNMTQEETAIANSLHQAAGENGQVVGIILDMTLQKSVQPDAGNAVVTKQAETPLNLEIDVFLPQELMNKQNYTIYRYHDNDVDKITTTSNSVGEELLEPVGEELVFTAQKFSLYAIAYDNIVYPEVPIPEETSVGKSGGKSHAAAIEQDATIIPVAMEEIIPENVPVEDGYDEEPKTGDSGFLLMPVAMGATTTFMLKILLWLQDLEFGMTEERKNELIRFLAKWAYGGEKGKVYLAVGAMAMVLMLYHLCKVITAKLQLLGYKIHFL